MRSKLYAYTLSMISMAVLLSGCGNGGGTPAAKNTLHESTACLSCHDDPKWVTPGTGKPVVAGWKLSTHMTANGAGCVDCHDDGYMHPASCNKCHSVGSAGKEPHQEPRPGRQVRQVPRQGQPAPRSVRWFLPSEIYRPGNPCWQHYRLYPLQFRPSWDVCGNQLYTILPQVPQPARHHVRQSSSVKQWAESGHGSTRNAFITGSTDFKSRGSTSDTSGQPGSILCPLPHNDRLCQVL